MVIYDYDSNAILDKPIKNRRVETICDAFLNIHNMLKSIGSNPKCYIMDNDFSSDLKYDMKSYNTNFQIAPPNIQQQNSSERAI